MEHPAPGDGTVGSAYCFHGGNNRRGTWTLRKKRSPAKWAWLERARVGIRTQVRRLPRLSPDSYWSLRGSYSGSKRSSNLEGEGIAAFETGQSCRCSRLVP